jgi:hypothetical protein
MPDFPQKPQPRVKFLTWQEFLAADPPPDLQALVRDHGDWLDIPEDQWQAFHLSMKKWQLRARFRA